MAVATQFLDRNRSAVTGRSRSPAVWSGFNTLACLEDPGFGTYEFHDFNTGGLITAPTTHAALVGLPISGYSSSASQISYGNADYAASALECGTIVLAETTTREGTAIRSDVTPYRIATGFGLLCFEARFKISAASTATATDTNEMSFFVGLLEPETLSTSAPIIAAGADTHLMGDFDFVGFHYPVGDTTTFDSTYRNGGGSTVIANDGLATIAEDTYVKVGMRYDPNNQGKFSFYINNAKQATEVSAAVVNSSAFPYDKALGWCIAMSVGTAANDNSLTCDWIAVGQHFV